MSEVLASLQAILPQEEAKSFFKGRKLDCLQPLLSLGFLKRSELSVSTARLDAKLASAVSKLHLEARAAGFPFAVIREGNMVLPAPASLEWMHQILALENEFPILELPQQGETSLWSRILHYRLWAYGLWSADEAENSWNARSIAQLRAFAALFKCQIPKALEMLSDIHKIIDLALDEPHFFNQRPQLGLVKLGDDLDNELKEKTPRKFLRRLRQNLSDSEWEKVRPWFKKPPLQVLDGISSSFGNQFTLRLLRIYQWVKGYYRGDLGPDFHRKSLQSLKELGKAEGFKLKEVLGHIGGDYWAINVVFLLRRIDDPDLGFRSTSKKRDQGPESFDALGAEMQSIVTNQKDKKSGIRIRRAKSDKNKIELLRSIQDETSKKFDAIKAGHIDYVGGKTMLKTAGKILKRFWTWLTDIWRDIKNVLKNALGFISRNLRRAYLWISDGMSFLFGKRLTVTENAIYSKMDFDFDAVNAAKLDFSKDALENHGKALSERAEALDSTLYVIGKIIRLVYDVSTPNGWVHLGMKIVEVLKAASKDLFSRKGKLRLANS